MIFPLEALNQSGFNLGDEVEIIKIEGGILLKPADPILTLADILAGSKPEDFALTPEDLEWDSMPPRGEEL
jgi:bifunctional DNA-binding transcriptional regulator/antitoxin component of YhaV-PrlF toxin-antitoxin module